LKCTCMICDTLENLITWFSCLIVFWWFTSLIGKCVITASVMLCGNRRTPFSEILCPLPPDNLIDPVGRNARLTLPPAVR
jgi:hypothetical protein